MELDENGCPEVEEGESSAKECPPSPCKYCTGNTANGKQTSWEWCQDMKTCAATVDWDKVYGHG